MQSEDRQYFKTGAAIFVFLFASQKFTTIWNNRRKIKKQIHNISSIPIKNLDQAAKEALIQKKSSVYFIDGTPIPQNLLATQKKIPVVLRIKQRKGLYSQDSNFEPKIKFDWKKDCLGSDVQIDQTPFFLFKDKIGDTKAFVTINDGTDIESGLTFFGFKDEKRNLTFSEKCANSLWVNATSAFKLLGPATLAEYFLRDGTFKGIHLGWRDSEFGIRAEGILSILGQIIYDQESKQLRIENPIAVTLSKTTMLTKLNEKLQEDKDIIIFWLIIAFASGLYLSRRTIIYHRRYPQIWNSIKQKLQRFWNSLTNRSTNQQQQQQQINNQPQIYQPPQYSAPPQQEPVFIQDQNKQQQVQQQDNKQQQLRDEDQARKEQYETKTIGE